MTPTTLKAARAGLDWSQSELADHAGVHAKTVAYYERATRTRTVDAVDGAIPKIRKALSDHGVTITDGTVRFQQSPNP